MLIQLGMLTNNKIGGGRGKRDDHPILLQFCSESTSILSIVFHPCFLISSCGWSSTALQISTRYCWVSSELGIWTKLLNTSHRFSSLSTAKRIFMLVIVSNFHFQSVSYNFSSYMLQNLTVIINYPTIYESKFCFSFMVSGCFTSFRGVCGIQLPVRTSFRGLPPSMAQRKLC